MSKMCYKCDPVDYAVTSVWNTECDKCWEITHTHNVRWEIEEELYF
jgi:hypothetical protein